MTGYAGQGVEVANFRTDRFTGNGSTVNFTLSVAPPSVDAILVNLNGQIQDTDAYAVSGTTLTLDSAPFNGAPLMVKHLGVPALITKPSDNSVDYNALAAGSVVGYGYKLDSVPASLGAGTFPFDDSKPQSTEGNEVITLDYTPKLSGSLLLVEYTGYLSVSVATYLAIALFQDSGANAIKTISHTEDGSNNPEEAYLRHVVVASSTNQTTFKIRAGATTANTVFKNRRSSGQVYDGTLVTLFSVTEIKQ